LGRRIAILSAEPSGDLQAAALITHLKQAHPDWTFFGTGAHLSRAAGLQLWADSTLWSVVGVSEALLRIPKGIFTYLRVRNRLLRERPDLVIVIDAPAIHMRLAGALKKHGLRFVYYFPPSAWTTNPKRLRQIHQRVEATITAFSFSAQQYRKHGLEVAHFGHPLVDLCQPVPRAQALAELGLPEGHYAALLPGSRTQEIRLLLPVFLEVARRHPHLVWLLPTANPTIEELVRQAIGQVPTWLKIIPGHSRAVMTVARAGLLASGSATLEAALLGLPHLICYRLNPFDYWLGKTLLRLGLIKVGFFGLPNLIVQRPIVAEFLQDQVQVESLTQAFAPLVLEGPTREQALQDLGQVRQALGKPGVIAQVAHFVEELVER